MTRPVDPLDAGVTEALRAWRLSHSAGLPLAHVMTAAAELCGSAGAKNCFLESARLAGAGEGIERLLQALAPTLPEGERAILAAGWNSGRFEQAMDRVLARRELWLLTRRRIRSKMLLPIGVLFLAALIAPLPSFIQSGSMAAYVASALLPLAAAWAAWLACSRLWRARIASAGAGAAPPTWLDRLLVAVPLASAVERYRNVAESASLLSQLVGAGVKITDGLALAARAAPNGLYRESLARAGAGVRGGQTLSAAWRGADAGRLWPEEFLASLAVGEQSGALEEVLDRQGRHANERYAAAMEALGDWLPRLAYGLVALYIIWQIFSMLSNLAQLYQGAGV